MGLVIIWVAGAIAVLVLAGLIDVVRRSQVFSLRIWAILVPVKFQIKRLASRRGIPVAITTIGAVAISPVHLSIWIVTDREWERRELMDDKNFLAECRQVLKRSRYPAFAVPEVGFAIISQEMADRKWGGRLHMMMQ